MPISTLILRVKRREDGKFVAENPRADDQPLAITETLTQAIGVAFREAVRISRDERFRVSIDVELPDGQFRRERIINPPVLKRRSPWNARPRHVQRDKAAAPDQSPVLEKAPDSNSVEERQPPTHNA